MRVAEVDPGLQLAEPVLRGGEKQGQCRQHERVDEVGHDRAGRAPDQHAEHEPDQQGKHGATRLLAGPEIDDPLAVVVITTFDTDEYVSGALKAGAQGRTNGEIAGELHISLSTVKFHLASLMNKIGVSNPVQIAIWAYETRRVRH